jgi:hypothetical protein
VGIIPHEDRKPGLRVRHRHQLWTGTVKAVMPAGFVAEVLPDGGAAGRWFNLEDFDAVPAEQSTLVLDRLALGGGPQQAVRLRYLTDAAFYNLANQLAVLLRTTTVADIQAALDLAAVIVADDKRRGERAGKAGE